MNLPIEEALVSHLMDWVRRTNELPQGIAVEFTSHTDLIAAGVLDSRGFIELMLEAEQQTGHHIDLNDVDPSEFTTIRGLCRCAMAAMTQR